MSTEKEFVEPFDNLAQNTWVKLEHIGRYIFARDIIKTNFQYPPMVLDIGCGNGYGSSILADSVKKCIGVDYDPKAIKLGRKNYNYKNIDFNNIDLDDISKVKPGLSLDNKIEAAVAFETLEHLEKPEKTVQNIAEILQPGGIFICSVPNSKFESLDSDGNPKNIHHLQTFTFNKVEEILSRAGFKDITFYGQAETNSKLLQGKESSELENNFQNRESKLKIARQLAYPTNEDIRSSYSIITTAKINKD